MMAVGSSYTIPVIYLALLLRFQFVFPVSIICDLDNCITLLADSLLSSFDRL